jgi:hypothetical protein
VQMPLFTGSAHRHPTLTDSSPMNLYVDYGAILVKGEGFVSVVTVDVSVVEGAYIFRLMWMEEFGVRG